MSLQLQQPQTWETTLLAWAVTAMDTHRPSEKVRVEAADLDAAYATCAEITRKHSRTFYLASGLLPLEKRRAARALYAFCRVSDNLVDDEGVPGRITNEDRRAALETWRQIIRDPHPPAGQPVALAWADARERFGIPTGYAEQLIDGVARDLDKTRYTSFDELAAYAYGVASTVGLMAMHIIGFAGEHALPYAVKLGVALQITNILRDVGEDWRAGRVYLPQDELAAFGLTEDDIAAGRSDRRWRAFMQYQIARNRRLYAEGLPGVALLNPEGRFAITAAADLYQAILSDIEAHDHNVFNRRAHVGTAGKARRLPRIWWRSRRLGQ